MTFHELGAGRPHMDNGEFVVTCFYDLSKAFDRVWHEGLLSKLKPLGIQHQAWLTNYLNMQQRVAVNGQYSEWTVVPAGVPQDSVLGPLLFLVYSYDLPAVVADPVLCNQFADDTALQSSHQNACIAAGNLQQAVDATGQWLTDWRLLANFEKTKIMEFQRRSLPYHAPPITLYGSTLNLTTTQKHLGVTFSSDLRWNAHIDVIASKASRLLGVLRRLRSSLSRAALSTFYLVYIRPILEYADTTWADLTKKLADRLERLQRKAARIICGMPLYDRVNHTNLLATLGWPTLASRRLYHQAVLAYQLHRNLFPSHVFHALFDRRNLGYNLRRPATFDTPIAHTVLYRKSPLFSAANLFNTLPSSVTNAKTLAAFKRSAGHHILTSLCKCSSCTF